MSGVRLMCPLCGATVADGAEPEPGRCPGCAARYAGGGDDVNGAVARALAQLGIDGLDPARVARGLFELAADDPRAQMTSDRRAGFYRWWLFVAADREPAGLLRTLAGP